MQTKSRGRNDGDSDGGCITKSRRRNEDSCCGFITNCIEGNVMCGLYAGTAEERSRVQK